MHCLPLIDYDPTSLAKAQSRLHWPKWQTTFEADYASLRKHRVFGFIFTDLQKPSIGYKLIFTRKIDARGNVTHYKVRLIVQGFCQISGVDFYHTYPPVMDIVSFRFFLAFTVQLSLHIYLLDVVIAYLHGLLDTILILSPPPGFFFPYSISYSQYVHWP